MEGCIFQGNSLCPRLPVGSRQKSVAPEGRKDLLLPVLNNLAFGMSRREKMALDASDLNENSDSPRKRVSISSSSLWNDFSHGGILAHGMRMGKNLDIADISFREECRATYSPRAVRRRSPVHSEQLEERMDTWYSYNGYASFSARNTRNLMLRLL